MGSFQEIITHAEVGLFHDTAVLRSPTPLDGAPHPCSCKYPKQTLCLTKMELDGIVTLLLLLPYLG